MPLPQRGDRLGRASREQVRAAVAGQRRGRMLRLGAAVLLALPLQLLVKPVSAVAATQPATVTLVGSFQSELGCPGDFQPDCAATQLTYDATDDVWQGTFTVPAGQWQYKVALNGTFDVNYGANATLNGPNISLTLGADTSVTFYYDNKTHWITDNQNSVIVTAPGDYQHDLGCPTDFDPSCLRSWLEDPDGNGIYQFSTDAIPAGTYQTKAAINESFAENYGAGGVPNGPDITFTVPANATVTFTYDPVSHILSVTSTTNTTTSIISDAPDPSVAGQPVPVQYSVAPVSGTGTPTGTVTVSDGTESCTGTVAAGQCSLTFTTAGAKSLTASYAGDSSFQGSTSAAEAHQVNAADTTTTITSGNPDPSVVGQSVTVQYSVGVNAPGSGTPTGNVTVSDGTVSCTATVAAGQCSLAFTSAGSKFLTASYAGDPNFNGSTSAPETHTVDLTGTTTTITSDNPDPSDVGQAVTVQYNVTANAPGAGTPTGNVTVSDGVDSCTSTVAVGQCSITLSTVGGRTLTAAYAGDANFNGSTSAGEPHAVLYGFGGFMSPLPKTTLQKSGSTIPVKFRLTNAAGQPISSSAAAALAAAGDVKATLTGPGIISPPSALCTWDVTDLLFQCNIKTPSGLRTGTAYKITAQENVTGTFVIAPAVSTATTSNPETVYFK